jgi:hypothetical protein
MNSFVLTRPGTVTKGMFFLPTIVTARFPMSPAWWDWIFQTTAEPLRSPTSMAMVDSKSF